MARERGRVTGLLKEVDLTSAQREVVSQPWHAKTLVTAGAGAGKTTTLARRLEYLAGDEQLEASEILVLSFSRAAVRELRNRVDRMSGQSRRVRAQTFDGWAMSLLHQMNPDRNDLIGTSFDRRIELATEAISTGVMESFEFPLPAHIVIDEVQDLVGVRREMVEALIARYADNCGFTVVGDAAQSIYGFQVVDKVLRAEESNRFIRWIRRNFSDELEEVVLDENFRALTPDAAIALPVGKILQNVPANARDADELGARVYGELRGLLDSLPEFGQISDRFVQDSLRMVDSSTAILCRDNGQVLWLSKELGRYGIPHQIQRSPRTRPAPAWLATIIRNTNVAKLDERRFSELGGRTPGFPENAANVWKSLRRAAPSRNNQLDVDRLCKAIAEGRLPDELTSGSSSPLLLSTIHRAKGLEFDRVLIVEPYDLNSRKEEGEDAIDEARLFYVAMTRARYDVYRLKLPSYTRMRKATRLPLPTDRWFLGGYKKWARNGIEMTEVDVAHENPAGVGEPVAIALDTQNYLSETVNLGDEISLIRLHDLPVSPEQSPPFGIFHRSTQIGEVSERFREDLHRLLKTSSGFEVRNWPHRIAGVRIDALESVAGSAAVARRSGLGDRGIWIAPRLCGLGIFEWSRKFPESEFDG